MENLHLETLAFAIFFQKDLYKPKQIFSDLETNLDFLNGVKVELPDFNDLPSEVPRLIHRSINDEYNCQISKMRIDFIFRNLDLNLTNAKALSNFHEKIKLLIPYVSSKTPIHRFGLVGTFFIKSNNSVTELKNKYFNHQIHDVTEISLRFNKPFIFKNHTINDVISIEAGINREIMDTNGNLITDCGILIERDLNNVVSDKLEENLLFELFENAFTNIQSENIESLM